MAVFRVQKTQNYTIMSNHHLRNKALSLKAKGLLSLMLSLPEDWDYTTRGLASICKEGVDSVCATVRELEAAGYIIRRRIRDKNGQMRGMEYTVLDQPQPVIPLNADQRVRVAVFRLKHDARRQLRHQPALPRDAEFIRKIRADMRNRMNCVLHGNVCPLFVVYYIGKKQILQLPHLPTIVEI